MRQVLETQCRITFCCSLGCSLSRPTPAETFSYVFCINPYPQLEHRLHISGEGRPVTGLCFHALSSLAWLMVAQPEANGK